VSVGRRIDALLSEMELLSEVGAASLERGDSGKPESCPPPGAFDEQTTVSSEWQNLLDRLTEAMEVELRRYLRSGEEFRNQAASNPLLRRYEKDERIRVVWRAHPVRFVSYIEDVPEAEVIRVRGDAA